MSKHTIGPWCQQNGNHFVIETIHCIHRHEVAKLDFSDEHCAVSDRDEMEANARLIAAAPELLEALKALYAEVLRNGGHPEYLAYMQIAKKAILKAEGSGK